MKFLYKGPFSGVTLDDGKQVLLHPDSEVDLPAENEYTKTLVSLGHLTAIASIKPKLKTDKGENDGS